jgi:hypothetical protein
MNGPVVIFALLAISINPSDKDVPDGTQTVGYYATAAECQKDLIRLYNTADKSKVRLDCKPLRITE